MRRTLCLIVLLLLAVLPSAASAKPSASWPSAADLRAATPGLRAPDSVCIARFYKGRLSRRAWFTPYYKLTRKEKITTDLGFSHCMTKRERVATLEREAEIAFGRHYPQFACVARLSDARSRADRLAVTTLAKQIRAHDSVYRACGLIGAFYAIVGHALKLALAPAERSCTNRNGSAYPLRPLPKGQHSSKADQRAAALVFDRCVGRTSEDAMWRRILHKYRPAKTIPCIAHRMSASTTFVRLFTDRAGVKRNAALAVAACASSTT